MTISTEEQPIPRQELEDLIKQQDDNSLLLSRTFPLLFYCSSSC